MKLDRYKTTLSLNPKRQVMKKLFFGIALLSMMMAAYEGLSQDKEKILAQGNDKDMFAKKFKWGVSLNQYWGTIKGTNLPNTYFAKPCIGFNVRAEYYPLSFVGVAVGFGMQQRGAGIINPDNYGGAFTHPWIVPQYDSDSTYRERLRVNTIEVPITLLLRTPKDLIKGMRLSAAGGIVYSYVSWTKDAFLSVEDGYHKIVDLSPNFLANDVGYQFSVGPEIDAGGACVLQVHFVYTKGTKNVYYTGPGDGRLETYGFRVAWLF